MKMTFGMAAAVGLLIAASGGPASADMIFDLSGVTLAGGGTLTGSFTTNNALNMLVSSSITATNNGSFTGFFYNFPGDPTLTDNSSLPTYIQIDNPGHAYELRLYFDGPLTAAGASLIHNNSFENEGNAGYRLVSGSIVAHSAVPEPGAFSLLASAGASILVGGAWRRRRTRFLTAAA